MARSTAGMKRVVTLHLDKVRLTPELSRILSTISDELDSPTLERLSDGSIGVYVDRYSRHV